MNLADIYQGYIGCLNRQDWATLKNYVQNDITYNGKHVGLDGYRAMLENDFQEIPDLYFNIQMLISDPPIIGCRLSFRCTPKGMFFGLPVYGKKIDFTENVFYHFESDKIDQVWSVIDKAAIEAQL